MVSDVVFLFHLRIFIFFNNKEAAAKRLFLFFVPDPKDLPTKIKCVCSPTKMEFHLKFGAKEKDVKVFVKIKYKKMHCPSNPGKYCARPRHR